LTVKDIASEKKPSPVYRSLTIFSHRCLGFGHKENSFHAFRAALDSNIGGIEIDIRLTKDHKWVVIHNPFFKSEEKSVLHIYEHTYNQIKREITLLDTMLAFFVTHSKNKQIMIDVKDVGETRQLVKLIKHYGIEQQAIILAWEPEILRRVHAFAPELRLGLTYVPIHSSITYIKGETSKPLSKHRIVMRFNAEQSFNAKFKHGVTHHHYLATLPELPLYAIQVPASWCSSKLVKLAHEKNMKVFPFGVKTRLGTLLLKRQGVDGILTDYPMLFIKK